MSRGKGRPASVVALADARHRCRRSRRRAPCSRARTVGSCSRADGRRATPPRCIYLLPVPSNTSGGGTLSPPVTPPGGQYRHPTWSPDRTKIAYANGSAGEAFDIFVQDIAAGTGPQQLTRRGAGDNLSEDRPAWSPDGTRLAWEHQPTAGSTDRHIRGHDRSRTAAEPRIVTDLDGSRRAVRGQAGVVARLGHDLLPPGRSAGGRPTRTSTRSPRPGVPRRWRSRTRESASSSPRSLPTAPRSATRSRPAASTPTPRSWSRR